VLARRGRRSPSPRGASTAAKWFFRASSCSSWFIASGEGQSMPSSDVFTTRPVYMGTHGVIASGHYLGALAGQRMFDKGGNAIDAAVASGYALNVLEPQSCGIGGEVPILVYSAKDRKPHAISGQGFAPKAATVEWFRKAGIT